MATGGSKAFIILNRPNTSLLFKKLREVTNCIHTMKAYFPHPRLLKKWGIAFNYVVQRPGDLLYIIGGAAHAEASLDFSMSKFGILGK